VPIFFQSLGENTCSLQSALKNTAPGLQDPNCEENVILDLIIIM